MKGIKFIYEILDPDTLKTVYVGSATNVEKRARGHLSKNDSPISIWVQNMLKQDKKPIFNVIDKGENDGCVLENKWILKRHAEGHQLLNKRLPGIPKQPAIEKLKFTFNYNNFDGTN